MKRVMKSTVNRLLSPFGHVFTRMAGIGTIQEQAEALCCSGTSKTIQWSPSLQYRTLLAQQAPLTKLSDVGFHVYAQTDEDGIILLLFSVIGTTNKIFVEIGASNGIECNYANPAINLGWHGLFIDANESGKPKNTGIRS